MGHKRYLKLAVNEAFRGMQAGDGGPFGALIVREGEILGKAHNSVLLTHDPSAHAEVNAIRSACKHVKHHHLSGATLYTNFEPCPMCLGAIYWADIRRVVYCAGREVAGKIGFMDESLYEEFTRLPDQREVQSTKITLAEMDQLLEAWEGREGKVLY